MGSFCQVSHPTSTLVTAVTLPGSKSESNRALILNRLSGNKTRLVNLSEADDTTLLAALLGRGGRTVDVKDCGACLRFLIAFYCAQNRNKVITGSARLCQRPVGKLVQALCDLGFKIHYPRTEGYPPLEIVPVESRPGRNKVEIDGSESSQYLSALAMIAPSLAGGLSMAIQGRMASEPYLQLTLHLMRQYGAVHRWDKNTLIIEGKSYKPPAELRLEGDWSSAACWYAAAALSTEAQIDLHGLSSSSAQGDKVLMKWMKSFGLDSTEENGCIRIKKTGEPEVKEMTFDFTDHPDLAPTMLVLAAAKNVRLKISGLENLRIKESDRVEALTSELRKINARLEPAGNGYDLKPNFRAPRERIETYNDHRMVMAFAPLGLLGEVSIARPQSVTKSYPKFWDDWQAALFKTG